MGRSIENMETAINEGKKTGFDVQKIRKEFPILGIKAHDKPLVYLDNAATTQKPRSVIDKITEYYTETNSNIHRGVHYLSQKATGEYENAREVIQKFINAARSEEIIYTRGATEAVNLVAHSFVKPNLKEGDEILITHMEHHANIVPWQIIAEEKKAVLKVVPINDKGELNLEEFEKLLNDKTKFVSVVHVSNSLGTINPIEYIIEQAHNRNVPVLIDGAQSVQHIHIDIQKLDCDFYTVSGHKVYGPTGIGFLYAKKEHLEKMTPYQGGGDMIASVSFEKTIYNELPYKFEAGTQHIAGAIALAEAIKFIGNIGIDKIAAYEEELLDYGTNLLTGIEGLRLIGTAEKKASILSFVLENVHPHDIGTFLDMDGVAVRTGHHCTEPVMRRFGIPATTRASLSFYNTKRELDILAESIRNVIKMFT